ncbi:MAG: chemoreceptor glutamine deamidase CheD [Mariprofundaceae bacterium]
MPKHDGHEPLKKLPGFEHINSYFDKTQNIHAAKLLPGDYYVTTGSEVIVTVLGSCISACIRDKVFGIGGMNHFMLPLTHEEKPQWGGSDVAAVTRYGNFAMEHLIADIISQGGMKKNLEIKIFGGGRIMKKMNDVGKRNIDFIREYLRGEALSVAAHDVGGDTPRKVYYYPSTGRVRMKRLQPLANDTIARREENYLHDIEVDPVSGDIDLFD